MLRKTKSTSEEYVPSFVSLSHTFIPFIPMVQDVFIASERYMFSDKQTQRPTYQCCGVESVSTVEAAPDTEFRLPAMIQLLILIS